MSTISIKGLSKPQVFAALYNGAKAQGFGFLHYDSTPMTDDVARERFGECDRYYDYVDGRVMKVSLEGDEIDPWGYDCDNGQGAVKAIIDTLRETNYENAEPIERHGLENTRNQAIIERDRLDEQPTVTFEDGIAHIRLTASDLSDTLRPILDDIIDDE